MFKLFCTGSCRFCLQTDEREKVLHRHFAVLFWRFCWPSDKWHRPCFDLYRPTILATSDGHSPTQYNIICRYTLRAFATSYVQVVHDKRVCLLVQCRIIDTMHSFVGRSVTASGLHTDYSGSCTALRRVFGWFIWIVWPSRRHYVFSSWSLCESAWHVVAIECISSGVQVTHKFFMKRAYAGLQLFKNLIDFTKLVMFFRLYWKHQFILNQCLEVCSFTIFSDFIISSTTFAPV